MSAAGAARSPSPVRAQHELPGNLGILAPLALLAAVVAFATLPPGSATVASLTSAVLLLVSATDIERGVIPNRIVLPSSAVVLLLQIAVSPGRSAEWLLAGVVAALILLAPQLLRREWMGMGDVKLGLLLGVALGWSAMGAILLAFLLAFPVAVLVLLRDGLGARKRTIPFGPFLSLAGLIALLGPHLSALGAG